jgi:hypothetical protein
LTVWICDLSNTSSINATSGEIRFLVCPYLLSLLGDAAQVWAAQGRRRF